MQANGEEIVRVGLVLGEFVLQVRQERTLSTTFLPDNHNRMLAPAHQLHKLCLCLQATANFQDTFLPS